MISAHVVGIASDMRIGFGEDQFSGSRKGKGDELVLGLLEVSHRPSWGVAKHPHDICPLLNFAGKRQNTLGKRFGGIWIFSIIL